MRDLGGLVVIDFIDMMANKNQRAVENRLRDALKIDRARVQTNRISKFGLMEMSRQRLRPSLGESTQIICPRCTGHGSIRSIESLALSVLRLMEEEAMKDNTGRVVAQIPVDIASYLLNEKRENIAEIEMRNKLHLLIVPNAAMETPHFTIERIRNNETTHNAYEKNSYELAFNPDAPYIPTDATGTTEAEVAAVGTLVPNSPAPTRETTKTPAQSKGGSKGILARLFALFFGDNQESEANEQQRSKNRRNQSNRTHSRSNTQQTSQRDNNPRRRDRDQNRNNRNTGNQSRNQPSSTNARDEHTNAGKSMDTEAITDKSENAPLPTEEKDNNTQRRSKRGGTRRRRTNNTRRPKQEAEHDNATASDNTIKTKSADTDAINTPVHNNAPEPTAPIQQEPRYSGNGNGNVSPKQLSDYKSTVRSLASEAPPSNDNTASTCTPVATPTAAQNTTPAPEATPQNNVPDKIKVAEPVHTGHHPVNKSLDEKASSSVDNNRPIEAQAASTPDKGNATPQTNKVEP